MFFLVFHATLFVTIASSRAEVLSLCGGGVKCAKSGLLQINQSTLVLQLSSGMPYIALTWLKWWCFFQSGLCCITAELAHLLPDLPPPKGNISVLKLAIGYKRGRSVKQKEYALQWYVIQCTSFPNYGFKNGSTCKSKKSSKIIHRQ